jgi:hypothetical protein
MKRAAFWLLCLFVLIPAAAFADSLDSAAPYCTGLGPCPTAFTQYDFEQFLAVKGTGNLLGNLDTQIDISGPAGTFTQSVSSASAVDGGSGQLLVTLLFSVPDDVLIFTGHYSVILHVIDDTGVRDFGPVYFDVVPQPVVPQPPLISAPENVIAEATSPTGADVFFDVSSFSFVDPTNPPVICNHPPGSHFPLGPTSVTCTTTDSFGSATAQFEVEVTDTVGPVLHLPATIVSTSPVVTYTVTATDNVDSAPHISCSPGSGSTFAVGSTIVSCTATDSNANSATGTFRVTVTGGATAPTLIVPNDITAEATSSAGAAVTFTATSSSDATVVCSPASGSTFAVGDTTVGCTATSPGGASADSFVISVVDTTAPVLTLPATINAGATSPSGAPINFVVAATDIVDGPTAVLCDYPSGVTLPVGTTIVQCTSTDSHFNTAVGSFTVIVSVDVTPPVLNLPANITAEATGPNGAIVSYSATAIDDHDGPVPVTCDHASGSVFAIAFTTVQCTASDSHGNIAHGSFTVTVRDTTPPVLSLPASLTAEATGPGGAAVSFSATSADIVDGSVPVTCNPASGSTFPLGTTTVQCTATDAHNNTAHGSFTVTVVDTTPPTIVSITASPNTLWPPNHQMVNVTVSVIATDLVDPAPMSHIVSVSSNQPIDGTGDGDTAPDWVITGPLTLQLRSERSSGIMRVYTITVAATDASGNTSQRSVTVSVGDGRGRAVH